MTEEQMKERMKEIDEIRRNLSQEKLEYEKYFDDKRKTEEDKKKQSFCGKCFILKDEDELKDYPDDDYVKAFKIIKVIDRNYAECIIITEGIREGIQEEIGISRMNLGLWTYSFHRKFRRSDALVIDCYKEISEEEFNNFINEHKKLIGIGD